MKSKTPISRALALFCLLALNSTTVAHTWVEELRLVASSGNYVGAIGYPRGFVPRSPGPGDANSYRIDQLSPSVPMCNPLQKLGVQTGGFPRLKAAAKDHIAVRYEENGHVSLFKNNPGKALGRGVVYIYGTKAAKDTDTLLGIHGAWNADSTGGDKRGKLIATRNYDDGRCFQNNPSNDLVKTRAQALGTTVNTEVFCQNDIQLPDDIGTSGMYTLYWVWDWSTMYSNGKLQTNEMYTTCMDIDITSSPVPDAGPFTAVQSGTTVNSVAIAEQINKVFIVDPTKPLAVAPDNLGAVQPPGVPATAKPPVLGSLPATSAAPPAASKPTTAAAAAPPPSTSLKATASASKLPASSIIQSPKASEFPPAPTGFVTVTVSVPTTIAKTVTVFAPGQPSSPSVSYQSTVLVVELTTQTNTPKATPKAGGVFVAPAGSPAKIPASASKATDYVPVSTASGKYSTNTVVPTLEPFLGSKGVIRGRRF